MLRERLYRLSQASRYINGRLDVGAARRNRMKDLPCKLGDDAVGPRCIFTVPRVGYRMAGEAEAMDDSAGFSSVELPAQLE